MIRARRLGSTIALATLVGVMSSSFAHDLIDIYALSYQHDSVYQQARADYLSAREGYPQARANLLPSLDLSGELRRSKLHQQTGSTQNTSRYTLSLDQRLFHVNDWFALKEADYSVQSAAATLAGSQQELMIRTAEAYFNVLSAQDNLSFATAQRRQLDEQLRQTNERYKVGVVAITDVKEAQSRRDAALAQEIGDKNALADRMEELRALTLKTPGPLSGLRTSIPLIRPQPLNMEAWVETAQMQEFDLKAARLAVKAAKANVHQQQAGHLPTVDLRTFYEGRDEPRARAASSTPFSKGWSVAVQGNLPIFEGFAIQSRAKQASYDHLSSQYRLETARRLAVTNTRNAYRGVLTNISQVQALYQAVESAKIALKATKAGFSVGTKTNVDVLDRIADLFEQRQRYAEARYSYILSSLRLKREAGILSVDDLREVNAWLVTRAPHRLSHRQTHHNPHQAKRVAKKLGKIHRKKASYTLSEKARAAKDKQISAS